MPKSRSSSKGGSRTAPTFTSQQSLNGAIKTICDILRRSNCAGALQYVPELTWILFPRILDESGAHEAEAAEAQLAAIEQLPAALLRRAFAGEL